MTARMPIAAALLGGARIAFLGDVLSKIDEVPSDQHIPVRPVSRESHAAVMTTLRRGVPFDIQVASELYWCKPKDHYRLDRDFGSLRLPYPHCWFEWTMPKDGYIHGKPYHEETEPAHYAAYVHEEEAYDDELRVRVQVLACARTHDFTPVLMNEVALEYRTDRQGNLIDGSLVEWQPQFQDNATIAKLTKEAKCAMFVVGLALNLVNCRNVTTAPAGKIQVRRSGADKRRGVQPITYHTIVLPGMTVERGRATSRQRLANAEAMRLHRVRGHFKTFTTEAPLLGKHVGRYWWGSTVRGNVKHGQVVADYQVGAAT